MKKNCFTFSPRKKKPFLKKEKGYKANENEYQRLFKKKGKNSHLFFDIFYYKIQRSLVWDLGILLKQDPLFLKIITQAGRQLPTTCKAPATQTPCKDIHMLARALPEKDQNLLGGKPNTVTPTIARRLLAGTWLNELDYRQGSISGMKVSRDVTEVSRDRGQLIL